MYAVINGGSTVETHIDYCDEPNAVTLTVEILTRDRVVLDTVVIEMSVDAAKQLAAKIIRCCL